MKPTKANVAGLISSQQQSEMKSILAGTWPALKPLPVFKYQTAEYRATIDFDKRHGEWVCRKTWLASKQVQELRGRLSEITMALPHGEAGSFIEGIEEQEQEVTRDRNRRLHALEEWKETYKNGARYSELRDYLSESQRTEIDDSLRLSLTAHQLQFNAKNIAYVFDVLSTAGGRVATLIEFATRQKAKQAFPAQALVPADVPEFEGDNPVGRNGKPSEGYTDEVPAVSIKNILPERDQAASAEQRLHTASEQLEGVLPEIADTDSLFLREHPHQVGYNSPASNGFAAQAQTTRSPADQTEDSSSRFPVLKMSVFQVAALALLLSVAIAFVVGLAVGRGPLGKRIPEPPKSIAIDARSPALRDQAGQPAPPDAPLATAGSMDSAGTNRVGDATPSQEKSGQNKGGSEYPTELRSENLGLSPTNSLRPSAKLEVDSEHGGARLSGAGARKSSVAPNPAPDTPSSGIRAAPHLAEPSTILVSLPHRGSQPFKVSFPEKGIAATSSFAMSSQLSVVVPPDSAFTVADESARLEAGELMSFAWPRYPRSRDRYGSPQIIKVRATIGELGQVREIKFLNGSAALLPATVRAIREWRYKPTLLNKRPVQAQEDITIEFRPPQYSSRVSTQHASHN